MTSSSGWPGEPELRSWYRPVINTPFISNVATLYRHQSGWLVAAPAIAMASSLACSVDEQLSVVCVHEKSNPSDDLAVVRPTMSLDDFTVTVTVCRMSRPLDQCLWQ